MRDTYLTIGKNHKPFPKKPLHLTTYEAAYIFLLFISISLFALLMNWYDLRYRYRYFRCTVCEDDVQWICVHCNACYTHCTCGPKETYEEEAA